MSLKAFIALKDVKEREQLVAKTVKTADSSRKRKQKTNNTNNQANPEDPTNIHANQEVGQQNHPGGPGQGLNGPKQSEYDPASKKIRDLVL